MSATAGIRVKSASDIPSIKHWAIVTDESIKVPGYDPGDPSSIETVTRYTAYVNKTAWELAVKDLALSNQPYKALVVEVPTVTITVEVGIK